MVWREYRSICSFVRSGPGRVFSVMQASCRRFLTNLLRIRLYHAAGSGGIFGRARYLPCTTPDQAEWVQTSTLPRGWWPFFGNVIMAVCFWGERHWTKRYFTPDHHLGGRGGGACRLLLPGLRGTQPTHRQP